MAQSVKEFLRPLVEGTFTVLHDAFDDVDEDEEWTRRAVGGANVLAFNAWHMARTVDWAVQTVIRGTPEVVERPEWRSSTIAWREGIGTGISLDEADAVARAVSHHELLRYIDAVRSEVLSWFADASEEELTSVPDARAHEARIPAYSTPGHRAEVDDLVGIPAWQYLLRPAGSHIRVHYGESLLHKQAVRAEAAAVVG